MSPERLHEVVLPPFIAAVKAGARSVMLAFNDIAGRPSHANRQAIELLRSFGSLLVVGDYTGGSEMVQHGIGDLKTVGAKALKAGLDMDMVGGNVPQHHQTGGRRGSCDGE